MNAGNHHGIHDFPFQSIEEELNGFRLAADSCDGNGTTDEDGIGAEGQHLKDVFPMADTAVDEDRKTAFYGLGDFRQDVSRTDHTVEDTAAVVADDDAFGTGIGTGNGFFRRHDALYDKGQGRRFDQFGNVAGALRADGLSKDMHIDQRRRIDIAGNGKGMGLFSNFNLLQ